MPMIYVITGPAGVGKSTVSKVIAESKSKSALIEGDDIYSQVVGSYVSAWKEGNHLEVFWKISLDTMETYLVNGYDVIFNYIIPPSSYNRIKERFKEYEVKFVVLTVDEEKILKRDQERPLDCQMGDRCITLLNNFKKHDYGKDYFLDSTNLSVEDTVKMIEESDKFLIRK